MFPVKKKLALCVLVQVLDHAATVMVVEHCRYHNPQVMTSLYYCYNKNDDKIPLTDTELKELVECGVVTPDTLLETDTGQRGKAGQITELFATAPPSSVQTAPPNTATYYFYTNSRGEKKGLYDAQQLKELATRGLITRDTPIETAMGSVRLASQIPGLLPTTPPPTVAPRRPTPAPRVEVNPFIFIDNTPSADGQKLKQGITFFRWLKFWVIMLLIALPLSVLSAYIGTLIDVPEISEMFMFAIPLCMMVGFMLLSALYWVVVGIIGVCKWTIRNIIAITKKIITAIKPIIKEMSKALWQQVSAATLATIENIKQQHAENKLCVPIEPRPSIPDSEEDFELEIESDDDNDIDSH